MAPSGAVDAPEWFRRALAAEAEVGQVQVDGATIVTRRWGERGRPGVVLVHGGGAHSRWWDHIGPLLATECSVVALDLSGHGDSDRRAAYSFQQWGAEVLAVAQEVEEEEHPVVVGHSMGGYAAIYAAACCGDDLKGIIVVDSPVYQRSPEEDEGARHQAFGPLRLYPSREVALEHFHLVPDQPIGLQAVFDHIKETSLKAVEGGWTWKFDPRFVSRGEPIKPEVLAQVSCRVALVRAEHGLVTKDIGRFMYDQLGRNAPVIEIPDSYHHVMVDQPLSLVTAVRTLLADWRHSLRRP